MSTRVQLHNFRFSIYIDADGTVTLTDLPPELRDVVAALDPTHQWGTSLCRLTSTCFRSPSRWPYASSGSARGPGVSSEQWLMHAAA